MFSNNWHAGTGIYFVTSLATTGLLLGLARKWPDLVRNWTTTEMPFLQPPYRRDGHLLLSTKIRATALCFFTLTFGANNTNDDNNNRITTLHSLLSVVYLCVSVFRSRLLHLLNSDGVQLHAPCGTMSLVGREPPGAFFHT